MYQNLNQFTSTNLNIKYNNTHDISNVNRQLNTSVTFTKNDLTVEALTNQVKLYVYNRIIKNCIILCPDGQIWTGLDYQIHESQGQFDDNYTVFNFSYVKSDQWLDGNYYIYVGSMDNGVTLANSNFDTGIKILKTFGQHYFIKKLIAGNRIKIKSNDDAIVIEQSDNNFIQQPYDIQTTNGIIDLIHGNMQIIYTYSNDFIVDLIDTYLQNDISNISNLSSNSYMSENSNKSYEWSVGNIGNYQVLNVSLMIYKPNETTLKYNDLTILQKYDVGWFACSIKKMFGKLFISEPTRIITDFQV